ncbi:GerA spore germination protein [Shouchella lonarensis]|uniref:GerA spore germination protein n=1 Tax=Shouchella lonarensis TaxID=1464122 RepID=A0A1G6GXF2_9BACI|nr:GerA spore germination protein [Shouchella lonarensis]
MSFFFKKKHSKSGTPKQTRSSFQSVDDVLKAANDSCDFTQLKKKMNNQMMSFYYFSSLVDETQLIDEVVRPLQELEHLDEKDMVEHMNALQMKPLSTADELERDLLTGYVLIRGAQQWTHTDWLVPLKKTEGRQVSIPEVEFSVFGSKESFVEMIDVNINLLRTRLPTSDLRLKKLTIGELSKTTVYVAYLQSVVNEKNVQTVLQRLGNVEIDQVQDSSIVLQMMEDNSASVFPQFIDTERPDRTAASVAGGRIAILTDGSSQALLAPVTAVEFITSFEDSFLSWPAATFLRLLRLAALFFSIFATPLYVAVLTYHPEIIPQDLFSTLMMSRRIVPFPPIVEALFLETTIELLREAGARLPTKIGQTIGIVGGIVIGTAAVEAGLTSNVLLIIVALAALTSFTVPIYRMGTTIRIVRFPFIIAAQVWGLVSIGLMFIFIVCHLLSLTSLGRPYMAPIYPFSWRDLKDTFVRLPLEMQTHRQAFLQTKKPRKFQTKTVRSQRDIDDGY